MYIAKEKADEKAKLLEALQFRRSGKFVSTSTTHQTKIALSKQ